MNLETDDHYERPDGTRLDYLTYGDTYLVLVEDNQWYVVLMDPSDERGSSRHLERIPCKSREVALRLANRKIWRAKKNHEEYCRDLDERCAKAMAGLPPGDKSLKEIVDLLDSLRPS